MGQFTLEQLRRHGIDPDTSLGQHFLVDDNILDVIERLAELRADDVVYEPGPGVGVLTVRLAERVRRVHAVELDRRLERVWPEILAAHPNIELHYGDAVELTAASLDPACTALVSNLPYHVSGPIVAETIQRSPGVERFCVMVQREVADRFFAPVGSKNYGALSVLVQGTCERTGLHNVGRGVFMPQPNVDSALVAFRRRAGVWGDGAQLPAWGNFLRACFGQRRKTLANNLLASGVASSRTLADDLIVAIGAKASVRPQELTPEAFRELFTHATAGTNP